MSGIRQCPLCFENYDDKIRIPRILPKCLHSMCSLCLPQLYKNPEFVECPTCRQISNVRLDQVPKNRDILEFLEFIKSQSSSSNDNNGSQALPQPPPRYSPTPSHSSYSSHESTSSSSAGPSGFRSELQLPVFYNNNTGSNSQPGDGYHHQHHEWNEGDYLKGLFDDIDHNKDGHINFNELYEALRKGQPNSRFDQMTVKILLDKYDRNHDNEISFEEFYNLFVGINEQYNEFLDTDVDGSGSVEMNELNEMLGKRRLNFSPSFYHFLFAGIFSRIQSNRITFDIYVRLIARLDKLLFDYNRLSHGVRRENDFESFVRANFFQNF